jgi:hypothetical protein
VACSACNCTGTLNKPDTAVFQAETDPDARDVLSMYSRCKTMSWTSSNRHPRDITTSDVRCIFMYPH